MDTELRISAETAAHLLLRAYKNTHPEWTNDDTPVDEIIAWLGIHVETFYPQDYPQGTYGFIDPDEDEALIWLCRDLPETFRRFTLAHELGHALLHCRGSQNLQTFLLQTDSQHTNQEPLPALPEPSRADPCNEADVQESMTGLFDQEQFAEALGIGQVYDPRSQREIMANIFAAELLMPLERLQTLYLDPNCAPQTLASRFGVSQAALLNRLAGFMKAPTAPAQTAEQTPQPNAEKKRYDVYQQAAIEAATPALIVAGPGSGKTSTLIGRTEYLVNTLNIAPQCILALTFSRKAAQEMEERLSQVISGQLPKVSTFHAFCADTLRKYGTLVGLRRDFTLIDEAEGYFILRQQTSALRLQHYQKLQAPTYYFPDMLKAISRAKDELVTPDDYAQLAHRVIRETLDDEGQLAGSKALEIAQVYKLYEQALRARGDTDFGGLLMLTVQLFREHPEILQELQQRYQHILVDEFQDVNRASGVLLRELASRQHNVWVVGDANQAIYGFRGASPANISQFTADFPGATVLPLSQNYRSRPDLVAVAEAFRCTQLEPDQQPGKNRPTRETQAAAIITIAQASDEERELAGIVQDINHKRKSGYAYKDMIVLCRTRSLAQKVTRTLAEANLPVIERGGTLEQEHSKNVLSILLLLTNDSGMGLLRAAHQPDHALTQQDVELLLLDAHQRKISVRQLLLTGEVPLNVSLEGHHALTRLSAILQTLQRSPDVWTLLAQYLLVETSLVHNLLDAEKTQQQAATLEDYDRLLTLARHYDMQEQLRQRQQEQSTPDEPIEPPALDARLQGFLEYLSLLVLLRQDGGDRQGAEEEEGEQADIIQVMTVHASKGLEFPVVYMPGLSKRRFPLQGKSSPVTAPTGMLPAESEGSTAHESGEACLFYVGVTRAREQLILSYSERYGKQKYQRSPYLDALENAVPKERLTRLEWNAETVTTAEKQATDNSINETIARLNSDFVNSMHTGNLSAGAIEAYQRCPRQYAYSNIYHFHPAADGYQLFWQATQRTVEAIQKKLANAGTEEQAAHFPSEQEIQALYTQHWQELGGDTAHFSVLYEDHGHEVTEAERRRLITNDGVQVNMRSTFEVNLAGRTVQVNVDRVEESKQGEPVKFVRTRFGQRKERPTAEMREYFYTLALRQHHSGQEGEIHSHNLSTGETVPIKMTAKKEQSLQSAAEQSIKGITQHNYPAHPAEPYRCPGCPFFLICPA